MQFSGFRFHPFVLDVPNRRLIHGDAAVDLNNRYFDALALLVSEAGNLVSKDRFMEEIWRGVPVTDEALTQCIRTLRRVLQDDASRPRFIETVPKHGYRFIASVEQVELGSATATPKALTFDWRRFFALTGAGIVGGGVAGLIGGLIYGFLGATQVGASGGSIVLVLTAITVLIALVGASGVSLGIAAASVRGGGWHMFVAGGAFGGLVVGGLAKLLGSDAFALLLGQSPGNITGALEGAMLGGAAGLGVWLGRRGDMRRIWPAALIGALAGALIVILGGRLLGGSLSLLTEVYPQSRLRPDQIGAMLGEHGFGPLAQVVTGSIEALLFTVGVAFAMCTAHRQMENT
ncbi:transcriptional regulator [Blastomonas sp.]|uniref:winged helix-turn-helix domain-containing protein n=1 Tax=Blastomonas sp. TaxID=1909299 RepID=UPI0035942A0A